MTIGKIGKDILAKFRKRTERKTSDEPDTALQRFEAIIAFINSIAYVVGIEFTSDWQFNFRTKCNLLMNACINWVELYTFVLLFPSIVNHGRFMSLVDFVYKLASDNAEGRREAILFNTAKTIFYHFKLVGAGFFFGAAVYMLYPVYDFSFNGNMTPISPLIFPFATSDSLTDFLISTALNLIPPTWNIIGIAAVSCLFITFVDVYASLISLIEDDFRTFDGLWITKHPNKNLRKLTFKNIILEISDLARYSLVLNDLFGLITTVQIGCCFLGIATAVFGYLANDFIGGIGASLYFTTELMMFCFIGQLMDNQVHSWQKHSNFFGSITYFPVAFSLTVIDNGENFFIKIRNWAELPPTKQLFIQRNHRKGIFLRVNVGYSLDKRPSLLIISRTNVYHSITSDRIAMIIFNSNWYLYDEEYKKDLLFALSIAQNLKLIDVAGIMPLNFETGVVVAKNIYSIIMFLLEALE